MILAQLPEYKITMLQPNRTSVRLPKRSISFSWSTVPIDHGHVPIEYIEINLNEFYEAQGREYWLGYYEKEKTFFLSEILK